jgi:outer membrane receptor protein involved in Fe transport
VLNAVTLDPEPDGAGFRYDLESGFAALPENAAFAAGSMARAGHGVLLELHGREADDAEAGGGEEIFNSSYSTWGAALRYTHHSRAGRLRLGFALDRVDDLGKAAIDSRAIRAVYPLERSDRLTASWLGAPKGDWDTSEATIFLDRYRVVLDRDRAPSPTSNRRIDSSDTDAKDGSLRLLAGRPALGGRLQLGLDAVSRFDLEAIVSQTRYAADGTTIVAVDASQAIAEASQIDGGLFATWTRPLAPRWKLAAGARGDEIRTENRGGHFGDRSVRRGALSGNLSISGGPFAGWTTTLQAARGFRSPTLSDRYFRGPSGRGFVTGNPDLDPETSLQWDLSSRWSGTDAAFGAFLYRYRIDDLIERYGSGADFFFRNRGTAIVEGIELEAQWTPPGAWTLGAGAAAGRGRTDGGAAVDDIAAPNCWLTARRSFGRGFVFGRVFGALRLRRPGPTEFERPGYGLIDVGGGWRMSDRLELRALVRNAADRRYIGAGDNAADYAPGRSLMLSLAGRL